MRIGGRRAAARRGTRTVCAVVLGCSAFGAALPGTGHARSFDILEVFADDIEEANERSGLPVLLPARYRDPSDYVERVHGSSVIRDGRYAFTLAAAPNCGGATACFLVTFSGRRGAEAPSKTNVQLAGGIRGRYVRGGCGASCAPSRLTFKRGGSVYRVTAKETKAQIVRMANGMIRGGAR